MIWAIVVLTDIKFKLIELFIESKALAKLVQLFVQIPED